MCTYGSVGAESLDVDVVEGYILGTYKECCPAWRVEESDSLDIDISSVVCQEEDGSIVGV